MAVTVSVFSGATRKLGRLVLIEADHELVIFTETSELYTVLLRLLYLAIGVNAIETLWGVGQNCYAFYDGIRGSNSPKSTHT